MLLVKYRPPMSNSTAQASPPAAKDVSVIAIASKPMMRFQGGAVKLDDESIYSRWLCDSVIKTAPDSIYLRWMSDGCGHKNI